MAEYAAFPLWWAGPTARERDTFNLDPATLPLSEDTIDRIHAWASRYESTLNWENPASSGFPSRAEEEAFEIEGIDLWKRLRKELGDTYNVVYHSEKLQRTVEDPMMSENE